MYLKKLHLINFKNYREEELSFSPGINCFVGENGAGKTNLLDAACYLSFCKSFSNPVDSQNIMHGSDFFMVRGLFDLNGREEKISCSFKKGTKKQFSRNRKEYSRLADHIGLLPVVMISPEDHVLVTEGSEIRRKFLDAILSQLDKDYLDDLLTYHRALVQRNALLRNMGGNGYFDADALSIWDEPMIAAGERIHEKRAAFVRSFFPVFKAHYHFIAGTGEEAGIAYQSQMNEGTGLASLLLASREKDRHAGHSTAGIHKDDLIFKINGFPVKKIGSQGQQKSFVIGLRLAQFEFIRQSKSFPPVLLLDDIFDKLDQGRVARLIGLVCGEGHGQIFLTHTHRERVREILEDANAGCRMFLVNSGYVKTGVGPDVAEDQKHQSAANRLKTENL